MIQKETIGANELLDYTEVDVSFIDGNNSIESGCSVATLNEYSLDSLKTIYTPIFLRIVKEEYLESGYTNSLDDFINGIVLKDPIIASTWFNYIYLKYNSNNRVMLAMLYAISRIDNILIRPTLSIMALASLSHSDIEIRETAIRCFENWGDSSSLEVLKATHNDPIDWINDYKNNVIQNIENTLN